MKRKRGFRWTDEMLLKLCSAFKEKGLKHCWAEIKDVHPDIFAAVSANTIGGKARNIGLSDCTTEEEVNEIIQQIKTHHISCKRTKLDEFSPFIVGGNKQSHSGDIDSENDEEDNDDLLQTNQNDENQIIHNEIPSLHSSLTATPISTNCGILFPPFTFSTNDFVQLNFLTAGQLHLDWIFLNDHTIQFKVTILPLPEELVNDMMGVYGGKGTFTSPQFTYAKFILECDVIPELTEVKEHPKFIGIKLYKRKKMIFSAGPNLSLPENLPKIEIH